MRCMSCHLGIKLATWFGLTSGVETKSAHDRVFDSSMLNDHAMASALEHLKISHEILT